MITEKVVTLIVSGIGIEMAVNLVFVDNGGVVANYDETALALFDGEARVSMAS